LIFNPPSKDDILGFVKDFLNHIQHQFLSFFLVHDGEPFLFARHFDAPAITLESASSSGRKWAQRNDFQFPRFIFLSSIHINRLLLIHCYWAISPAHHKGKLSHLSISYESLFFTTSQENVLVSLNEIRDAALALPSDSKDFQQTKKYTD
jgi:hypothetical protein